MSERSRALGTGWKAVAAVLLGALFVFGIPAPAAHAVAAVDVTVVLTSKSGAALSGVNVYAYPVHNHDVVPYGVGTTASAVVGKPGRYLLEDLDQGQEYTLYFDAPSTVTTAFDQFWGGTTWIEEAGHAAWNADTTVSVSLATNSTITGVVKNSAGRPISGVDVHVERWDGSDWFPLPGSVVTTNSAGGYAMRNLEPGSYAVAFAPDNRLGYLPEFAGDSPDADHAAAVYVGLGGSAAVNAVLTTGGAITGTVGLPAGFQPTGIQAWAYRVTGPGNAIDPDIVYLSHPTGSTGKWTVPGLPAGVYVVKLYDLYGEYLEEWSVDQASLSSAQTYTVSLGKTATAGKTTLAGAATELGVQLVVTHDGAPVDDQLASVYIMSADGDFYTDLSPYTEPLQGGQHHYDYLAPGTYDIWVDPGDPAIQPYISTRTVSAAAGDDTWTIELDDASAFAFTTAPVMTAPSSGLGATFSISLPATTRPTSEPVSLSYLWLRDGIPIYGGSTTNKRTYVATGADVGHAISVLVRADTFGFAPIFTELVATNAVTTGAAASPTAPPTISAPAVVVPGSVLSANLGTWNASPLTFSYQWSRHSDGAILGTQRTYTVRPEDANEQIDLLILTTAPGRAASNASATNPVTVGYLGAPRATKNPALTIRKLAGGVIRYSLNPGKWSPAITSFGYLWTLNGAVVGTAAYLDCTALTCPAAEALEVQLTTNKLGYTSAVKRYGVRRGTAVPAFDAGTGGVDLSTAPGVHLTPGDLVQYGQVLTAVPSTLTYSYGGGGTVKRSYQWQRLVGSTWSNISKATKQNYTVSTSDNTRQLRLRVTVSSTLFPTVTEYLDAGRGGLKQDLVSGSQPVFTVDNSGHYGTLWVGRKAGDWNPGLTGVAQRYQWYTCNALALGALCDEIPGPLSANWKPISRATSATYTPPASLNGRNLAFVVTATKAGYQGVVLRSPVLGVQGPMGAADTIMHVTSPSIVGGLSGGHATVGVKLTAKRGTVDVAGASFTGRWQYCDQLSCTEAQWHDILVGGLPVSSLTFVPGGDLGALAGIRIRFTEFASRAGTGTGQASTPAYALAEGRFTAAVAPKLVRVGTVYTVSTGAWPAGTTVTHEWFVADDPAGADPSFDTSTVTDPTKPVTVVVTATRPGYADPLPIRLVAKKGVPVPAGAALSGEFYLDTFSISGSMYDFDMADPKVVYKYQWYSNGVAIKGQTAAAFRPSTGYLGRKLTVRVSFSSPYFTQPGTLTFPAVTLQKQPSPAVGATIATSTGVYEPGSRLTAVGTGFPSGTKLSYNWQRSIDGGVTWTSKWRTASYWVLGTYDGSAHFRVVITGTKTGYATMTAVSAVIASDYRHLVTLGQPALTPAVAGAPVGTPLTVSAAYTTTGVLQHYTWYRNGAIIHGVTSATWTPPSGSAGDEIRVMISASKPGYNTVGFFTNSVQVGQADPPIAATKPVISGFTGAPMPGDILSATTGTWTVDGLQFGYQWMIDGTPAPAGTQVDFVVPAGYPGGVITVQVSASKTGWQSGASTSLPAPGIAEP